jgi:acyl carrier protein
MDDVEEAVISATVMVAGVAMEDITPDRPLQDLGIDSLEFISLVREIEETLDVTLPDSEAAKAVTIGDLVRQAGRRWAGALDSLADVKGRQCLRSALRRSGHAFRTVATGRLPLPQFFFLDRGRPDAGGQDRCLGR